MNIRYLNLNLQHKLFGQDQIPTKGSPMQKAPVPVDSEEIWTYVILTPQAERLYSPFEQVEMKKPYHSTKVHTLKKSKYNKKKNARNLQMVDQCQNNATKV